MKENLKARSGNRIVVMFDGKQLGLIQSVRMNDDYIIFVPSSSETASDTDMSSKHENSDT